MVRNAPSLEEARAISAASKRRTQILSRYGIPPEAKVLLHAGGVADDFGVREEVQAINALPPDVYLVLMGPDRCPTALRPPRVVSVGEVSDDEWLELLGAADIGLALWTGKGRSAGTYDTPYAWNRLYWYLAAGLPVIAGGHPQLSQLIAETRAGLFIGEPEPDKVRQAISVALMRQAELSACAQRAFYDDMNFESQAANVIGWLLSGTPLDVAPGR
ncbi:MAG: hypothetical protein QN131_12270 [Armatimonadota bacterium]|nr:hypothetical protein [Armatimonadota bacterium]